MAGSRYSWCVEDFRDFAGQLELPSGGPLVLEPFQNFILGELFAAGGVEVVCLLPKGQGKTTLLASLAVFHLLVTTNAECFIGAADKEQADEMYRFAAHFIESEPRAGGAAAGAEVHPRDPVAARPGIYSGARVGHVLGRWPAAQLQPDAGAAG